MKMALSKLQWAGAVLLLAGPVLHYGGKHMSVREITKAPYLGSSLLNVMRVIGDLSAGDISELMQNASKRITNYMGEHNRQVQYHVSRAAAWRHVADLGFALFMLGVGLFIVGGRLRPLSLTPAIAPASSGAEPPDGSGHSEAR